LKLHKAPYLGRLFSSPTDLVLKTLILVTFTSCGYQIGNVRREVPENLKKIAVPVFANHTDEMGVESYFTSSLIKEIERTHLAAVTSKDEAEGYIEGTVTNIHYALGPQVDRGLSEFNSLPEGSALAREYRVVVYMGIRLIRKADNKVLWEGSFSGEQSFPAPVVTAPILNTVNPLYTHSARHQAIQTLSQDLMAEAFDRMTENF